jgi:hypothetical protein
MMKKISTATISFLMHLPSSRVGSDGARVVAPSSLTSFPPLLFQEIDKTDDGFGKFKVAALNQLLTPTKCKRRCLAAAKDMLIP